MGFCLCTGTHVSVLVASRDRRPAAEDTWLGSVPVLERRTEEVRMRTRECVTVAEVIDSLKKENDRLRVINYQLKAQCEAKGASLTV